jgi:hypothetical protein
MEASFSPQAFSLFSSPAIPAVDDRFFQSKTLTSQPCRSFSRVSPRPRTPSPWREGLRGCGVIPSCIQKTAVVQVANQFILRYRSTNTDGRTGGKDRNACRRRQGLEGGGDDRDRTDGLSLAKAALSQLSYIPTQRFYSAFSGRCQRCNSFLSFLILFQTKENTLFSGRSSRPGVGLRLGLAIELHQEFRLLGRKIKAQNGILNQFMGREPRLLIELRGNIFHRLANRFPFGHYCGHRSSLPSKSS